MRTRTADSRPMAFRCFAATALTLLVTALAPTARATTVYDIGTIALSNGYSVSGTITTDETLGVLGEQNIVSYLVQVSGPRPYTFTPSSPSLSLTVQGVSATATELLTSSLFGLVAQDQTPSDCILCEQRIEWDPSNNNRIFWEYRDSWDGNPFIVASAAAPDDPLLIATAVPEPTTALLLATGLGLAAWRCESHRRRRATDGQPRDRS